MNHSFINSLYMAGVSIGESFQRLSFKSWKCDIVIHNIPALEGQCFSYISNINKSLARVGAIDKLEYYIKTHNLNIPRNDIKGYLEGQMDTPLEIKKDSGNTIKTNDFGKGEETSGSLAVDSVKAQDAGGPDLQTAEKSGNTALTTAREKSEAVVKESSIDRPLPAYPNTDYPSVFPSLGSRWYKVSKWEWNTTSDVAGNIAKTYRLPGDLLTAIKRSPIRQLLKIHAWWQPRITLRFQVNATKFHGGTLVAAVYYYPYDSVDNLRVTVNRVQQLIPMKHVRLNAASSNPAELEVDFCGPWNWIPTNANPIGFGNKIAQLYFGVLNKLSTGDNNCLSVDVITYIKFSCAGRESAFSGMRTNMTNLEGQMDLMSIAQPAIKMVMKEIGTNLSGNQDRPVRPTDALEVLQWDFPNLSIGRGPIPLKSMRLDKATVTPSMGDATGPSSEFSLDTLLKCEGFLTRFVWHTDLDYGKTIWSWEVTPIVIKFPEISQIAAEVPLSVVSSFYNYWRGGIKLKFIFGSSAIHTGRIRILYFPDAKFPGLDNSIVSDFASTVFDLEEQVEFTWVIPFQQPLTFVPIMQQGTGPQPTQMTYGQVHIICENKLRCVDNVSKQIDCSVLISADDDFELAVPRQALSTVAPLLEGQVGEERNDKVIIRVVPPQKITASQVYGENWNIPDLVRRFNKLVSFNSTHTYNSLDTPRQPFATVYVPVVPWNPYLNKDIVVTPTLLTTLATGYRFSRGSMRYAFNFSSKRKFSAQVVHIPFMHHDSRTSSLPDVTWSSSEIVNSHVIQFNEHNIAVETSKFDYNSAMTVEVPFYNAGNCIINDVNRAPLFSDATRNETVYATYHTNGVLKVQFIFEDHFDNDSNKEFDIALSIYNAAGDDFYMSTFQGFIEPALHFPLGNKLSIGQASADIIEGKPATEKDEVVLPQLAIKNHSDIDLSKLEGQCYQTEIVPPKSTVQTAKSNLAQPDFPIIDVLKLVYKSSRSRLVKHAIHKLEKKQGQTGYLESIQNSLTPSMRTVISAATGMVAGATLGPTAGLIASSSIALDPAIRLLESASTTAQDWLQEKNVDELSNGNILQITNSLVQVVLQTMVVLRAHDPIVRCAAIGTLLLNLGVISWTSVVSIVQFLISKGMMMFSQLQGQSGSIIDDYVEYAKIIIPGVAAGLGYASSRDVPSGLLKFITTFCSVGHSLSNFVRFNLELVKKIGIWVITKVKPDLVSDIRLDSAPTDIREWAKDVMRITEGHAREQVMGSYQLKQEVHRLYDKGQEFLVLYNEKCIDTRPFMIFYRKLVDLHQAIGERVGDGRVVKEPVCLWMFGAPGVGKSSCISDLSVQLLKSVGVVYDGPAVYVRSTNEYMNGYYGNPVILYDDFLANRSQDTISQQLTEYFQLLSGAEYNIPMPHLDDKNRIANPEIVAILANFQQVKLNALGDQGAFDRRRDMLIEARLSQHIKEKYPNIKDMNDTRLVSTDFEDFGYLEFGIVPDVLDAGSKPQNWLSYKELLDYATLRFKMLRDRRTVAALIRHKTNTSLSPDRWISVVEPAIDAAIAPQIARATALIPGLVSRLTPAINAMEGQCDYCRAVPVKRTFPVMETRDLTCTSGSDQVADIFEENVTFKTYDYQNMQLKIASDNRCLTSIAGMINRTESFISKFKSITEYNIENFEKLYLWDKEQGSDASSLMSRAYTLLGNELSEITEDPPHSILDWLPIDARSSNLCHHALVDQHASFCSDTNSYLVYTENPEIVYKIPMFSPCSSNCVLDTVTQYYTNTDKFKIAFYGFIASWSACRDMGCDICFYQKINHFKKILRSQYPDIADKFEGQDTSSTQSSEPEVQRLTASASSIPHTSLLDHLRSSWGFFFFKFFIYTLLATTVYNFILGCTHLVSTFFGLANSTYSAATSIIPSLSTSSNILRVGQVLASGDVQTPISPVSSNVQAALQGLAGQVDASLTRKITRNTLLWVVNTGTSIIRMQVLGIYGRTAVLPNHFWNMIKTHTNEVSNLIIPDGTGKPTCVLKINTNEVSVEPVTLNGEPLDIILVTFPNYVPLFKDIRGSLLNQQEMVAVGSSAKLVRPCNMDTLATEVISLSKIELWHTQESYTNDETKYQLFGWKYDYGAKGVCGSALVDDRTQKIIGIHTCGLPDGSFGFSTILTRGMFPNKQSALVEQKEPIVQDYKQEMKITGDMIPIGLIPQGQTINLPTKSKIVKSPAYGLLREPTRFPSLLWWENDSGFKGSGPLAMGINNHVTPGVLDKDTLDYSVNLVKNLLLTTSNPVMAETLSRRSFKDSINGIPGAPFFESVRLNTSPGYPLCLYTAGKKKADYVTRDTSTQEITQISKQLQKLYASELEMRKQGIVPASVYVDFLKDERRPVLSNYIYGNNNPETIKKTRLINGCSFQELLIWRQYTNDFFAAVQYARHDNGVMVGINADSMEWTQLANSLLTKGSNILTGDYSNFGPTISPQVQCKVVGIVNDWYKLHTKFSPEDNLVRETLFESILFSYHVAHKTIYQTVCGAPSGNPYTAPNNSIVNLIYLYYAVFELLKGTPFEGNSKYVLDNTKFCVYGDDFIGSVNDTLLPYINNLTLTSIFNKINIKFTDPLDKEGVTGNISSKLGDATFLKRSFKAHPYRSNVFIAPLETEVIEDIVSWVRLPCQNQIEQVYENMVSTLNLAYAHGPDYYAGIKDKFVRWCSQNKKKAAFDTWEAVDNRCLDLEPIYSNETMKQFLNRCGLI